MFLKFQCQHFSRAGQHQPKLSVTMDTLTPPSNDTTSHKLKIRGLKIKYILKLFFRFFLLQCWPVVWVLTFWMEQHSSSFSVQTMSACILLLWLINTPSSLINKKARAVLRPFFDCL